MHICTHKTYIKYIVNILMHIIFTYIHIYTYVIHIHYAAYPQSKMLLGHVILGVYHRYSLAV